LKAGDEVHGKRSVGAPFNVYLRNTSSSGAAAGQKMMVATYAVKPGDTLPVDLPLSLFEGRRYFIDVHGPNGFYRSFRGDSQTSALQIHTHYERHDSLPTGNIQVSLRNHGERPVSVVVQDNSYKTGTVTKKIAAGHELSIVLDLKQSFGWYDFTAKTEGSDAEARFAGRVESGRSSFSDPLMGDVV
jgi:phospholipase C